MLHNEMNDEVKCMHNAKVCERFYIMRMTVIGLVSE